jgi:hypothetical protein
MTYLLHMDTDEVRYAGYLLTSFADETQGSLQSLLGAVRSLDWSGPHREDYVDDFERLARRFLRHLQDGEDLGRRVQREAEEWEQVSQGAVGIGVAGGLAGISGAVAGRAPDAEWFPMWAKDGSEFVEDVADRIKLANRLAGLTILPALAWGSTYPGQRIVEGARGFKEFLGLPSHLTHIADAKLGAQIVSRAGNISRLSVALAGVKLAMDWVQDMYNYQHASWEYIASFLVVDTAAVGAGLMVASAGAAKGAAIGFAIGSAVPIVGNAAGAAIGAVVGAVAASWAWDAAINFKIADIPWVGKDLAQKITGPRGEEVTIKDTVIYGGAEVINGVGSLVSSAASGVAQVFQDSLNAFQTAPAMPSSW